MVRSKRIWAAAAILLCTGLVLALAPTAEKLQAKATVKPVPVSALQAAPGLQRASDKAINGAAAKAKAQLAQKQPVAANHAPVAAKEAAADQEKAQQLAAEQAIVDAKKAADAQAALEAEQATQAVLDAKKLVDAQGAPEAQQAAEEQALIEAKLAANAEAAQAATAVSVGQATPVDPALAKFESEREVQQVSEPVLTTIQEIAPALDEGIALEPMVTEDRTDCLGDVILGTGTSTAVYAPVRPYYYNSRSVSILLRTEFTCAPTMVTQVAVYVNTVLTATTPNVKIWLKKTTATTAPATWDETGATLVYGPTGYVFSPAGWKVFDIADFIWDTDNLQIMWEHSGGYPGTSSTPAFRYTSTSPNYRESYASSDTALPTTLGTSYNRPNYTLTFAPLPTTGACCIGTACTVGTAGDCTGTFMGIGSTCSPNPCSGACCYGTGSHTCADTSAADCTPLGGTWHSATACNVTFWCPPANDNCADVTPVPLTPGVPQVFTGDTRGATNDQGSCSFTSPQVWHAITLPTPAPANGWTVVLKYCGTTPAFTNSYINLTIGCPCTSVTAVAGYDWTVCGDGDVTMAWGGLAAGTYYYPVLSSSPTQAWGPYTITVVASPYCTPCYTNTTDEYITNVTLNTLNHNSGQNGSCSYGDYTGFSTDLQASFTYPITVTIYSSYTNYMKVWIDWNQNGLFTDAGEEYTLGSHTGSTPFTGSIAVPAGATLGPTRMRVKIQESSYPTACNSATYGETEDYTINVVPPPPLGACCDLVGGCIVEYNTACLPPRVYKGNGTVCTPNPCMGACCHLDGTCEVVLQVNCPSPSLYKGDGTTCATPCSQPGACCFADASCADLPDWACAAAGGTYKGAGTSCASTVCPVVVYNFPMNTDPGWTCEGQWAFGQPQGLLGDPASGHTGLYVYGYNLAGQYAASIPAYNLTTPALDLTGRTNVTLSFWRWLGVESSTYDHARVLASTDGTSWVELWSNPSSTMTETAWSYQSYALGSAFDNQATVYIRWVMGLTDTSGQYCGWNIDDVQLTTPPPQGACCAPDGTCTYVYHVDCLPPNVYRGDGTLCTPNPCMGACCDTDGTCDVVLAANCLPPSVYKGDGTVCGTATCPQPGACCPLTGICYMSNVIAPSDCAAGDLYKGDGTVCSPNPCPQPGACCFADASCSYLPDWACAAAGGTFKGAGTTCANTLCPVLLFSFPMDTDPAWTCEGQWAYGQPLGAGGDPASGHTGLYVYGYNLAGAYAANIPAYNLTTTAFDFTGYMNIELRFWRWLGVENNSWDHARILVSTTGTEKSWIEIWANGSTTMTETAWSFQSYVLPGAVNNQPSVYIRWVMGTTHGSGQYSGWNIDDVQLWGAVIPPVGACCTGATCAILSAYDCSQIPGAAYKGNGTVCSPNPCIGACCFPDGSCTLGLAADCTGSYHGDGTVCSPNPCPQPGDACSNPAVIAAVPYSVVFNNDLALPGTPSCSTYYTTTQNDWWFVYTPAQTCNLVLDVANDPAYPDYDMVMGIYTGPDCNNLTNIDCEDDPEPYHVEFVATAGTTYWFQIGDYGSTEGGGVTDFSLDCQPPPLGACCHGGTCTQEIEVDCLASSGIWGGANVPCAPTNPCATGACCVGTSCSDSDETTCLGLTGTYYPTYTCATFTCPAPGDNCLLPIDVTLPAQLPYTDANQYTCGRGDDYTAGTTCLAASYNYDGGEDIIYHVVVTEPICATFKATGNSSTNNYIGIAVDSACPPGTSCIAYATSSSGTVATINSLTLPAGTYTIMIDTWPSPACLTDFTLTIVGCPRGACCLAGQGTLGCAVMYQSLCTTAGGVFGGDGTACSGNDCNTNGTDDTCDIVGGMADCNHNGIPDACEIAANPNLDADLNGILDSCQPDCNTNGVPDSCEVVGGCTVGNCGTVYPLECGKLPDCNSNGIPDVCELGGGGPPHTYNINDGTHEDSIGITAGADLAALVEFVVAPGADAITKVSVAWGDASAAGIPVTVYVWSDPDQNGNPSDAKVLGWASTVTANIDTDIFNDVTLSTPVNVGPAGTKFFVGFIITDNLYPIGLDETTPVSGRNWIVGSAYSTPPIDPNNLGSTAYSTPLQLVETAGFPSNLMIRATGVSSGGDCNGNGIPDDCDIRDHLEWDCNTNGVIDTCEWQDCNNNGRLDACDISGGISPDCNSNGIPDECEVPPIGPAANDCNGNHIPDDCDLVQYPEWDCNGNGVIDSCDIANGTPDCNSNGIPDSCELWGKSRTNLVQDPSFEAGTPNPSWTEFSTNVGTPLCDATSCGTGGGTAGPRTGTWWAWFGGCGSSCTLPEVGTVDQTIVVPSSSSATLELYLWIGAASGDGTDYFKVKMDGNVVFTALENDLTYAGGYTLVSINVSSYANGGSHVLRLEGVQNTATATNFNVDDVSLTVGGGVPPNDCNTNGIPDECDIQDTFPGGYCHNTAPPCDTDYNHNGIPDHCPGELCGDLNHSGTVDYLDYWIMLDAFGRCAPDPRYLAAVAMDQDGPGGQPDGCIGLADYRAWFVCYQMANGKAFVPPPAPKPQPKPGTVPQAQPLPATPMGPAPKGR